MTDAFKISDDKIQEYIDGRLDDRDQASVAAYLLANPEIAAEIQTLRQQNEALKGLGAEVLSEPVPGRLTKIVDQAHRGRHEMRMRWARFQGAIQMAAAVLLFVGGVVSGWFGNAYLQPTLDQNMIALMSAEDSYLLYALERDYPVEFPADQEDALNSWVEKSFQRQLRRPPLDELGYTYVGGRVLPWSGGRQGLYLFQDDRAHRVAIVFWPSGAPPKELSQLTKRKNLQYRFWWSDGFGYAVLADTVNNRLDDLAKAVTAFYTGSK